MNVGSLFSGIGGIDLGLERAGHRVVFQAESDPWRRSVLAERFRGVPCFTDVGAVAKPCAAGIEQPERVDLLCGGFPCQDLSVAGRRAGLAGSRSGLFFEFARVAESLRPRWILLENVPGLLSSNGGRDFGVVLGTLADIGYGLAWRIVDSRFFGVPQRRRRVFILGALAERDPRAGAERAGEVLAVGTRCERHPATRGEAGADVARASTRGAADGEPHYYVEDFEDGTLTSSTGRIDRHPLIADTVRSHPRPGSNSDGNLAVSVSENQRAEVLETDYARQLTSGGGKPGQGYPMTRQGATVRRLTPTECERLQGFPDGWTALGPDSRRYAALGDAVTVNVSEWIGRRLS